ncbi:MAG TPA: alpha/beta hydrolase [Caulobacteraceae bacterium]|nr:alpha/beta hydrolase [Caulobacteraceae bacterium]
MADGQTLPPDIAAQLARFGGEQPPAPAWFETALGHAPERTTVEVEGVPIELLTWGEVGKPGLVFLHGNGAHADWWSFIAPFFAADYRIAAISWSGMGGSGWRERYTAELFGREVMAAIEAGQLGDKPLLVAHSFGGYQALYAAGAYGDRISGAVIVDSVIHPPEKRWNGPPPRSRPNRVYPTLPEALARFRLAPPQGCENLYIADFIARRSLKEVEGGWTWKFDPFMWSHFDRTDLAELLPRLRAPLAMVWGERSKLVDQEALDYMFGLLPGDMPRVVIPDADHHVMIDQPLAFVAALRGLLSAWPAAPR